VVGVDPGKSYLVTFDLGVVAYNTEEQRMRVRINGSEPLFEGDFTIKGPGNGLTTWQKKSLVFTADAYSAAFSFMDRSVTTNAIDMLLDNVEIGHAPSDFVPVPAGTFVMGSPVDEIGRFSNEPQREVTLTRSFLMKRTEVTWDEWMEMKGNAALYGYNDLGNGLKGSNGWVGGNHPVTFITWWDAVKWCNLASEKAGLRPVYYTHQSLGDSVVLRNGMASIHADWTAGGYRLPTAAEWEYACRAGTTTAFHTGPSTNPNRPGPDPNMDLAGWYSHNSAGSTQPVGLKVPNAWGLHDMHGNVWEYCWDYFVIGMPSTAPAVDPRGVSTPSIFRTHRGGSWGSYADNCRAAHNHGNVADGTNQGEGFRPVINMGP
jgi:formylglycine-generating enzyme required for sulfatase activity